MSGNLTIIHFGDDIHRDISVGVLKKFPLFAPTNADLYEARYKAIESVETEYFTLVDGYGDILLPEYEHAMGYICRRLDKSNLNIGSAREQVNGKRGSFFHHGVVCRTSAVLSAGFPKTGNYEFNRMVYGTLMQGGSVTWDVEVYNWIPSDTGLSRQPDLQDAIVNASIWLKERRGA